MSRRGENIYKRKDGRWEGRYHKSRENGKIKYGYVYAHKYTEVKKKLDNVKSEMKTMESIQKETDIKQFEQMAEEWLNKIKPQLKESSSMKYINILNNHLKPAFKDSDVEMITRDDVEKLILDLMCNAGKNNAGLSSRTVQGIISVLKNVLTYANHKYNLKTADISQINISQNQQPMRILSREEQTQINQYIYKNPTPSNIGIMISMYTGMRIGELCALKWKDFIVNERCIFVNKTLQRLQIKNNSKKKRQSLLPLPKVNHP